MGLARRAQGARRRRCGDIVDDEQRSDPRATPMRPSGSGVAWASAALPLLDDGTASPASRRLASARATPGTRPLLILGHTPSSAFIAPALSCLPRPSYKAINGLPASCVWACCGPKKCWHSGIRPNSNMEAIPGRFNPSSAWASRSNSFIYRSRNEWERVGTLPFCPVKLP